MAPLILIAALLAADAPQFHVDTINGASATGKLLELNSQQAVIESAGTPHTFKLSEVRLIGPVESPGSRPARVAPAAISAVVVETLDGARIAATAFEATKGVAKLTLAGGESIDVPTKFIHRVDFHLEGKAAAWPDLPKDAAGDLIVVQKKDAADLVEGVIGDVSAETVKFSVDQDVVPVKRARVLGLIYFHSQADTMPETQAIVENRSGSKIAAEKVELADGQLQVTTTFGGTLTWPLDAVRSIDFSPGRMLYLSDMQPDSSDWTPLLDFGKQNDAISQFYKPRFDRSLDGGSLSIGGQTYAKGVAMAARTVLEYKVAGRGREFRAMAGIDDSVHGVGSVRLTIDGDGKNLYSGKITGQHPPVSLNVDISDVKRIRIVADFGGGADIGDYLDLGDARIILDKRTAK